MTCIFGVDIIRGSLYGKEKPKYALFIVNDGEEIEKVVSRAKLFRLIRYYKPSIVSIDSISELFESKEDLIKFLKEIPPSTKLVQVSSVERGSLPYLSKRYGLKIDIRNPMDEAKACAYLASFGVGDEVSVFVDKTMITVSRNRSLGKGGWRQNKYRRKVHNAVRHVYREIKRRLDDLGLEYVEDVRESYGGISRGTLLVNAPKDAVPINSFKTRDVQVRVEAVEKEKIEFIPLRKTRIHTIVGVDPGTTTAVAVLDLDGNLLGVRSKKGWSPADVVEYILSFGKPVVIATDKSSPPDYVSKLRASFQAVLYTPKEDMSVEKKKSLASGYKTLNDHERDALAAAMEAYKSFKNKLMNIEKRIPAGIDIDMVKAEIIKGTPLKTILEGEKEEEPKEEKVIHVEIPREEITKRDRIIRELEEENRILRKEVNTLREEIERLRSRIVSLLRGEQEKIRKDNYIRSLEAEIKELRSELKKKDEIIRSLESRLETIKRMKTLELKGWKSIKVLKKFTKEEIDKLEKEFGINSGDVVYIFDPSGGGKSAAEYLCKKNIKAVIVANDMSHLASAVFEEMNIPVIHAKEIDIEAGEGIAIIDSEKFEKVYKKKVDEMQKRRLEKVEKLLQEYRAQRRFGI
jgi:predicted RNase H-like nuclease (RuvC/YqgF family)